MADTSNRISPQKIHYLTSRWSPERGLMPAGGFQWIEDRLQEASKKLPRRNRGRVGSVSRYGSNCEHMANRGGTLGFARVTGGLDDSQQQFQEVEDRALETVAVLGEKAGEVKEFAKDHRVPVPQTHLPGVGPVQSLMLKQMLCGILAGGVAGTLLNPLEIIKTRVMGGRGGRTVGQVVQRVTEVEGVQSLLVNSFGINVIRQALDKGVQFTTFEAVKRTEKREQVKDPKVLPVPRAIPIATLAGAAAGFTSTLFTYPFMVLNDRVILNKEAYSGFANAFVKVFRTEGLKELMRGLTPSLLRTVPNAAASFYTYESLKDQYLKERGKKNLDTWASLTIGAAAAAVGTTLTYPLEVARREISLSALPQGAVNVGRNLQYNNVVQALKGIMQEEGVAGLYRGLPLEYVEILPMTAVSFAVYEAAKRAFIAVNEERRDEAKG